MKFLFNRNFLNYYNFKMQNYNDIEIKRSLIKFLLNNDMPFYKKYATFIPNFTNDEIENLFQGQKDFNYNSINSKDRIFQKLLMKFNNFEFLLECWYGDPSKYDYIKQLWIKNQSLETLKGLNENERKEKLPFITKWPNEIQTEFNGLIDNYDETTLNQLKEYLEKEGNDVKELLKILKASSGKMKNASTDEITKQNFEQNNKTLFSQIFQNLILPGLAAKGIHSGIKEINIRENRKIEELLEKGYEYTKNNINLDSIRKNVKRFCKSNFVYAHAVLSFANLAWSAYEFYYTTEEIKKIGIYKEKLERIKSSFNNHCDLGLNNTDDIFTCKKKIIDAKNSIEKDFEDLKQLIGEIEASIQILENQKKKAKISTVVSTIGLVSGIAGAVLTAGTSAAASAFIYGVSIVANITSGAVNIADIIKAGEGIEELKKLLDDANNERKKMQEAIDGLEALATNLNNEVKQTKFNF